MADHSISIDVLANGIQETVKLLKEIRDDIKTINGTTAIVNVKAPNLGGVTKAINSLKGEIRDIAAMNVEVDSARFEGQVEFLGGAFERILEKLDEINGKEVAPDINSEGLDEAASKAERLAAGLDAAASIASAMSSVFSGLGDFGGMFADSLGAMSSMFDFDAFGTAKRYLTAMATKAVTGQISGIIERYDIMNTFADYMELAGVPEEEANQYLSQIDQSIRGIPIGLDEAAFRFRKYQMYLGDADLASRFTIGIQKAITAGGASEQMKTTAYTQIDRLLATGKLGQSRQWLSLFNGLGVSLKFLKQELGLDENADLKQVASELSSGAIPVEDFINAIANMSENAGLDRAIEIYKGTIEAWRSNINNAIKRGGQNILENVNAVMEDTLGFGITGVMRRVRDGIDTVSKDAGNYIKDNPQHVQTISDAIGGLIEKATGLDGGRFVENLVTNLGGLAEAIGTIFESMPPGFLEDFAAFATTWAGPMATVMKAAQGGLGVVLGVFERLEGMDMAALMGNITDQIWLMSDAVASILGVIPDGLLGDLMAFGLVWGKPLAQVLGAVSGALKDISGVIAMGGDISGASGVFGVLTSLVMNHPVISAAAVALTALGTGLHYVGEEWMKEIDEDMANRKLESVEQLAQKAGEIQQAISDQRQAFEDTLDNYDTQEEHAHQLVQDIQTLNDEIAEVLVGPYGKNVSLKDSLIGQQISQLEELKALYPELAMEINSETGMLTEDSLKILENADSYIEYATNRSRIDAVNEHMRQEESNLIELITTRRQQQAELEKQQKALADLETEYATRENETIPEIVGREGPRSQAYQEALQDQIKNEKERKEIEGDIEETQALIEESDNQIQTTNELIRQYGHSYRELMAMQSKFAGTKWFLDGEEQVFEEMDENLQNILADYSLMRQEQTEALQKATEGFEALEKLEVKPLSGVTETLSGNNAIEQAYIDDLNAASEWLSKMIDTPEGQAFVEEYGDALSAIFSQGFEGRDLISGLVDAMFENPEVLNSETLNQYVEEAMEHLNLDEQGGGLMADIMGKIMYGADYEKVKEGNLESEEFAWMQGMKESIVGPIGEIVNSFAPDGEIGEALGEGVSQTVESVINDIQPIEEAFGSAKQAAGDLEGAITNVATTASGQTETMGSFAGSLDSVASSATNAFSNVFALAAAISRLQDKEISIRVNVSMGLGRLAKGGMAGYFASGGNVLDGFPGMGSGSDIIPAWLTPGEYVIRRSAVGMFGSRLMERINKMDIGGAFDALMSRIANPMHMGGNTYNRDNHATVNNYFYGDNGQNYSQHKAYRYVGAL